VLVVGGSIDEWNDLGTAQWETRLRELGKSADHVGASWLTVRPYLPGPGGVERQATHGDCVITVDPHGTGRQRFVDAVQALVDAGVEVDEAAIATQINAPAQCDPDLVVVLGPMNRMPPSLMWELAYSELVYLDVAWADLHASHLDHALSAYGGRHRRFGGLD
jgi:undecaprenyl diphosphate synthase